MSHLDIHEMSLINLAEKVLNDKREPLDLYQLFDMVLDMSHHDYKQDIAAVLNAFYTDITSSAKFIYMGNNTWDLKRHQKNDLWDKDGSFYNEYTEVNDPVMDARIADQEAAEQAHLAKIEARRLAEIAQKEAAEAKAKQALEPVVVEPVLEAVPIQVIEPADELESDDSTVATEPVLEEKEPKTGAVETDAADEEEYDDFDEEEYNEYMDSYEAEYDK